MPIITASSLPLPCSVSDGSLVVIEHGLIVAASVFSGVSRGRVDGVSSGLLTAAAISDGVGVGFGSPSEDFAAVVF